MGTQQMLLGNAGDRVTIGFIAPTSAVVGVTATASFSLDQNGDINATATNNTIADRGDWIAPKVNMALYEVRATLQTGGPLSSGTMGVYQQLNVARTWTLAQPPTGSSGATVLYEIRLISSGLVVCSQVVTFSATSS